MINWRYNIFKDLRWDSVWTHDFVIWWFDSLSITSWAVMFILSILSEGSEPWEGNLVSMCDMLAKCLWNSDALSTSCICISAFDFIEVGPLLLFHFVNDSIIRHHLLGGTELFYIWKVSFCLYFKLFFQCEQCQKPYFKGNDICSNGSHFKLNTWVLLRWRILRQRHRAHH